MSNGTIHNQTNTMDSTANSAASPLGTQNDNIVSLDAFRKLRQAHQDQPGYATFLKQMSKPELLEEMVRFQEDRSQIGELNLNMILRGRTLFQMLEENAETRELQILSRSYRRHLEYELESFVKRVESPAAP